MKRYHDLIQADNEHSNQKGFASPKTIICFVAILLMVGILIRITYINVNAEKINVVTCPQGEWGELSGSYLLSNEEKNGGYAIKINECQLRVYSDYANLIGISEEQQNIRLSRKAELSRIDDNTPVINVNLTIRNLGEENGSILFDECILTSKCFNSQSGINFDIMPLFDDKIKERQLISIRPNTEYTLTVPFLIQDISLDEIKKNEPFYLAVTKYPTRLLLECPLIE